MSLIKLNTKRSIAMCKRIVTVLMLCCLLAMTSGCANRATAKLTPGADLAKIKTFYVVAEPEDVKAWNICKMIEDNLAQRGYAVKSGPELTAPYPSDVVVTYVDKWMWDMTMYLLELTITFRDPASNFPMAVGNSMHTSLTRKSPPAMVDEVLNNILNSTQTPQP
jgi:hypothetical protein